jgi:ribosomal protein S18 acetylase RimI-like enzyme
MLSHEIKVIPIEEKHIESFHSCLDSVAREKIYLGGDQAPPLESAREFVMGNIRDKIPQYVAVEGDTVVGWCDIRPRKGKDFSHCGTMGMGVKNGYRHQGIGTRLLNATIDAARAYGMERVELEVYTSNIPAIKLYEKRGFVKEGIRVKARKMDDVYYDIMMMALFL